MVKISLLSGRGSAHVREEKTEARHEYPWLHDGSRTLLMVAALPLPRRTLYKKLKARSGGFTLRFLGITYAPQESRNFQHPEFVGWLRSAAHISPLKEPNSSPHSPRTLRAERQQEQ